MLSTIVKLYGMDDKGLRNRLVLSYLAAYGIPVRGTKNHNFIFTYFLSREIRLSFLCHSITFHCFATY